MSAPLLKMADGKSIPQIGLGLWKLTDKDQFTAAFNAAVKSGYRHFDCAQAYGNEQLLGQAIAVSGIGRNEFFITTKIAVQHFGTKHSRKSFESSLTKLKSDYVDLLLLHFPVPGLRKQTWQVLEQLKQEGSARSIGVSNFTIRHLEQLAEWSTEKPAVNQVELHLFLQQPDLVSYCQKQGILIEAYSPLAHAKEMASPKVSEIASKYGVSYAQVMLRWLIEQGVVVLPKSANPKRIVQNIDLFNFKFSQDDLQALRSLEQNKRTCWNPELVP